jgi:hypothetical protein
MQRLLATSRFAQASLGRYPYAVAAVLFFAVFSVFFCTRKLSDWDQVYLPAAARLAKGDDIFRDGFVYPPINAWLALPFVDLPHVANRFLFLAVCAIGLVVLVRCGWQLAGGGRLQGEPAVPRHEHLIFGMGLLCGIFFAFDSLTNQQNDLVVAALVLAACSALAGRRDRLSGVLFGLAAGIKCTPLLWAAYLAWRRRWLAAVLVPTVAVAINLVPDMTHPASPGQPRLAIWAKQYLLPMTHARHDLGTWAAAIQFNHSLAGASNRWLNYETAVEQGELRFVPSADRPSPSTLKIIGFGGMSLFVLAALLCARKAARPNELRAVGPPSAQALEFSLVLILMLLLSPHSSKPHFCTLLLPGFCLARAALLWPDRKLLVLVLLAAALTTVIHKDLVGRTLHLWFMWHGVPTLAAVLLFIGCCWALVRVRALTTVAAVDDKVDVRGLKQAA